MIYIKTHRLITPREYFNRYNNCRITNLLTECYLLSAYIPETKRRYINTKTTQHATIKRNKRLKSKHKANSERLLKDRQPRCGGNHFSLPEQSPDSA